MCYSSFVYDLPEKPEPQNFIDDITIGVFFDGTLNNRKNIEAQQAYIKEKTPSKEKKELSKEAQAYKKYGHPVNKDTSFDNDHSNVDRLEEFYSDSKFGYFHIYVEGPGTTDLQGDDTIDGNGLGNGINGVRGKVRTACNRIVENKLVTKTVKTIKFDVFGFSRGAAAARNFVHEITQLKGIKSNYDNVDASILSPNTVDYQQYTEGDDVAPYGYLGYFLKKKKIDSRDIKIKVGFVGLYDTVASYKKPHLLGYPVEIVEGFEAGVKLLNLNTVCSKADRIVHLTAENEHRKNFSITPIKSSSKAIELALPGGHSDVGGCYVNGADEKVQLDDYDNLRPEPVRRLFHESDIKSNLNATRNNLYEQGWYNRFTKEIKDPNCWNELIGIRKNLSNKYSYITLQIMLNFAQGYRENMFDGDKLRESYSIPEKNIQNIHLFIKATLEQWQNIWQQEDDVNKKKKVTTNGFSSFDLGLSSPETKRKFELLDKIKLCLNMDTDGIVSGLVKPTDKEDFVLYWAQQRLFNYAFKNYPPLAYKNAEQVLTECIPMNLVSKEAWLTADKIKQHLPKLISVVEEQVYLRILRNRFLHWSATYGTLGGAHAPTSDEKRKIYNG